MQRNKISFKGQKIFIGIDVHSKSWSVCILTGSGFKKEFTLASRGPSALWHFEEEFPRR